MAVAHRLPNTIMVQECVPHILNEQVKNYTRLPLPINIVAGYVPYLNLDPFAVDENCTRGVLDTRSSMVLG